MRTSIELVDNENLYKTSVSREHIYNLCIMRTYIELVYNENLNITSVS